MLIKLEADLQEDSMNSDMMTEEDVFTAYPRLLDPDQSEKKMGMGKFADTLSERSLSTSTPCVRRSVSTITVEDDSGYAESLTESLFASANSTGYIYDDGDSSSSLSDSKLVTHGVRPPPKINIEFYSNQVQSDWDSVDDGYPPVTRLSPVKEDCMTENEDSDVMEADMALNGSSLAERFAEVLKHFSPQEPDRLIGRKMLLEKVDILSELDSRNLNFSCVSVILDYLEPGDICRMCQVSRQWKSICHEDQKANKRKRQFISQQRQSAASNKENHAWKTKSPKRSRGLTQSVGSSPLKSMQTLGSLQRTIETNTLPSPITQTTEKSLLYEQAAKSLLNDEYLFPCRKCSHPARVNKTQERAKCFNELCAFDFCIKCLSDFHGSAPCVPVAFKKSKTDVVGSKRSKKNLRRLTLGR